MKGVCTKLARSGARGFTLVELVASVAVMTVVTGGIASAMLLASHAVPDGRSAGDAVLQGYNASEQIVSELYCAQSFSVRTATAVEFAVADRDNDSNPETIRYEWSGTPGEPLTRQYNGAAAATVADDVQEFDLAYNTKTQTETTIQQGTTWTVEVLLASAITWDGTTPEYKMHPIDGTSWESEYLEIIPPEGATQLKITLAKVMLQHVGTVPEDLTAGIHRSRNDGTYIPDAVPIGTPTTIPGSDLTTMLLWHDIMFSDVIINDPARTDYCLVLKGTGVIPAYVRQMFSKTAPNDGMYERWTTDGWASWDPRDNQINQNDLVFNVYGSFAMTGEEEITTDRYFLTSIGMTLRVGSDPSAQVRTSSQIMNAPEVGGP
jgi:prepilin-type N-terminal cleavage/methylation domain-containing protein